MSESKIVRICEPQEIVIPEEYCKIRGTQEMIEKGVRELRETFQTIEPVFDVVQKGDFAELLNRTTGDGVTLNTEKCWFLPEAAQKSIGKRAGASFQTSDGTIWEIRGVKRKILPEMSGELVVKAEVKGITTPEKYRAYLREQVVKKAERDQRWKAAGFLMEELIEKSEYELDAQDIAKTEENLQRELAEAAREEERAPEEMLEEYMEAFGIETEDGASFEGKKRQTAVKQIKTILRGKTELERIGVKLTEKEYERFKARKKAESGVEPDYFAFVYEKCSSRLEHAANQYLKQHMKFEVEG